MRLVHTEVVADRRRRAPGRGGDQSHTRAAVPSLFRESRENDGRRPSMIISVSPSQQHDRQHARCSARATSDNFTIFEGPWPRSGSLASCRLSVSGSTAGGTSTLRSARNRREPLRSQPQVRVHEPCLAEVTNMPARDRPAERAGSISPSWTRSIYGVGGGG